MGMRMVVPPLALAALAIFVATAAIWLDVIDDVIPLGRRSRDGALFPLGSAQFIPRMACVLAEAAVANAQKRERAAAITAHVYRFLGMSSLFLPIDLIDTE